MKYIGMSYVSCVFHYNLRIERHENNCVSITGYYLDSNSNRIIYLYKAMDILFWH
jgi:hypothetical protein